MVDINKCNPCLPEDNSTCCDKKLVVCNESKSLESIQSSNTFKILLSLGASKLFPGLVCNSEKCDIDIRDEKSLEGAFLRLNIDCKDEDQNPLTITGYTIPEIKIGQDPETIIPLNDQISFPLQINLLEIHNKYLKPLIAAVQNPPVEVENLDPDIVKNFDPSCLLNSKWYEKNSITSYQKYEIKKLFLNDTKYCIPKILKAEVDKFKKIIEKELVDKKYILPNPDISLLLNKDGSPKKANEVTNLQPAKLFKTEIKYWHDIGFNMDEVKKPNFNLLTAPPVQKTLHNVFTQDRVRFDRWRKDIGELLKFYDQSFNNLFIKNAIMKNLLEAGCLNKESVEIAKAGNEEARRELVRSLFDADSLYRFGVLCNSDNITSRQIEKLFECLDKENITDNKGNPTGRFKFNNLKADIIKKTSTKFGTTIEKNITESICYKDLNINITGSCDNGLTINITIGEDACSNDGELPVRKINYAVLKRPLEFNFANGNDCDISDLIDSCVTSCCTAYDDSKKLLEGTGISDEDFIDDKLIYSKLDKEDNLLIGYTAYKCKNCDELEKEIKDFCNFSTQGFCCSEGHWNEVGGFKTLRKPTTAGLTSISECCVVAQNDWDKDSHFIFSAFQNSTTNKPIIVDKDRSGLQLLRSDLENSCLPKTKCCIAKRNDGACFYRKPRGSDRKLEYDISFEVNVLTLPEDHEGSCEESPNKPLGDTRDANGSWDTLKAFNDGGLLIPNFNLLMRASGDEFRVVLPSCDPFDTLKVRLSQSKSLPQDKQLIEFIRILLELKKLNRWVFSKDNKKNQNIIDIWDKELVSLEINMDDIASNSDNKINSIINSMVSSKLKAYSNLFIKRFATEGAAADDEQWIPYNYNGQPYSCNSYRSCFDFLKLEKKIFVYSATVNYCNLLDSSLLTNDMERLVAYLTNSSGTKFKSIISGALNRYAIRNKIEFIPGKCTDTSVLPPDVIETKYGCISSSIFLNSENCCPNPSSFSFSPSRGSYLALGGDKTLLDDPPHPIGTYSDGNNPYDANLLTQLKEAIVNDMFEDFSAHNGDGSGIYKIKLNIKNVNPCLEYDIEGTFKDYEGNIIDSELKCKNHAQHILECCDPDIEVSGGTCTTTPQTFNDYAYIPGLASLSQATVTQKTANCNMTADIKNTSSGNRVFIFSTNNPNPVLTNFGDKEILVKIIAIRGEIPNLYNKNNEMSFEQQKFRIKANELLIKLTTNDIPYSQILKDRILQHLNNLIKKDTTLPQPTDGHIQRTIWGLYIESDQIEVKDYPTDGCLELSAVQYTQKGNDKWVPSEYICIDNVPYPPDTFGVAPANRVPGTKYYNGEVVTDCGSCDNDPVSSPPPQDPSGPTDPSDPDSVPPGCEEIKKAVDAKKSEITTILMQLKDKLLNYNEKVLAWNTNDCSTAKPTQKCNNYKKSIEYNYIDADKRLLDRLNKEDITPGKEIITESALPFKVATPSQATLDQKTKYTKLLEELEKLENDLRNCD